MKIQIDNWSTQLKNKNNFLIRIFVLTFFQCIYFKSFNNLPIFKIFAHGFVVHSTDIHSHKSKVSIRTIRIGFFGVRVQVDRRSVRVWDDRRWKCQANVDKDNNAQKYEESWWCHCWIVNNSKSTCLKGMDQFLCNGFSQSDLAQLQNYRLKSFTPDCLTEIMSKSFGCGIFEIDLTEFQSNNLVTLFNL